MAETAAIPAEKVTGDVTVLDIATDADGKVRTREWTSAAKPAEGDKPARPAGKLLGYRVKLR